MPTSRGTKPWSPSPCTDGREPDDGDANAARRPHRRARFGIARETAGARVAQIVFGHDAAGCHEGDTGGHDERTIGIGEGRPKRFDGETLGGRIFREAAEIVVKGHVDHPVSRGRTRFEAFEVFERSAPHGGAGARKRGGGGGGAGEPRDRVARMEKFFDDGRADESGCSGDEDMHEVLLDVSN
jgi:hypothetical protein